MTGGAPGLHYNPSDDDALDTLRQQAQSISHNLHVDMDRTSTFALAAPGATEMSDGLLAADSPEALDELLRDRRDREPDLRLRRTLEHAEQLADRKDYSTAIAIVDQALGLDRTSMTAWLLKGRCLLAIDEFAPARQAIAVGRRHARDSHGIQLADAMSAACDKEEMRRFADHLTALIGQGEVAEARRQVQQRLNDQPDDATLLQNQCALLLLSDDVTAARHAAERALRTVDRSHAGEFEELLRQVAQRECEPRIRDARRALRNGDIATAVARLDECVAALGDNENFAALHSYAVTRHVDASSSALVRRWRRRRADTIPITAETLQWLLEWLVQEELTAGWEAFQAEDFRAARQQFTAAASIDGRCARVAYLHAAALFHELIKQLESAREPNLHHAHRVLVQARDLSAQCADDVAVGNQSRQLGQAIGTTLTAVETIQAQIARAQAIDQCVTRYNTLLQNYQRYPIRTVEQRDTARRSFDTLALQVGRLRRQGAEEEAVLGELASALADIRRKLLPG